MSNNTSIDTGSRHITPQHALERLVFFSDAVFAISITLLVIELKVPELPRSATDRDFLIALGTMTPHFVGFVVSFFVIGAYWGGHHRAFNCAGHWHSKLLLPNLFLLCAIAGMPFFTAFASAYYGMLVPTVAYCLWLLVVSMCNLWNNSIAVSPPVAFTELDPERAAMVKRRGWAVILGTLTALAVAFINPWLAQPALISMPLWRLLIARLHARKRAVSAP